LFLRFICPCLVFPSLIGFTFNNPNSKEPGANKPNPQAQRGLILLAKILQGLSNNVLFGSKDTFLAELKEVIDTFSPSLHKFLSQVSTAPVSYIELVVLLTSFRDLNISFF
jgi:hypothetical protein